ncbi:MAG: hypothetical protein EOO17_03980 [Chloroflexi bacterium]|nr:MAG: hypothetical protein EOO17_03980 [Chloroflexota bacterium]
MYPNQQPPQNGQQNGFPPQQQQPNNNYPQTPGYGPQPQPTYAVDYLDQIAPPPPRASFLSGSFGKILIILAVVLVFAISLIIALGGQKKTADTEAMAAKLENITRVVDEQQKEIKSANLSNTNGKLRLGLTNIERETLDLLARAEVKRSSWSKEEIAKQKALRTEMTEKFEDARLSANLDRVYAQEMAYQTELMINEFEIIAKKTPGQAFKDYSKSAIDNLKPINKEFAEFDESKD